MIIHANNNWPNPVLTVAEEQIAQTVDENPLTIETLGEIACFASEQLFSCHKLPVQQAIRVRGLLARVLGAARESFPKDPNILKLEKLIERLEQSLQKFRQNE